MLRDKISVQFPPFFCRDAAASEEYANWFLAIFHENCKSLGDFNAAHYEIVQ